MWTALSIPGFLCLFLFAVAVNASLSSADDHLVSSLPSFDNSTGPLDRNWAGYVPISENDDDHMLFYWMFEAKSNAKEAPLIVWLNGGPGCSSMDGLFLEHGPIKVSIKEHPTGKDDIYEVKQNPFSWNNIANIVYIDQPVGSGFSFSRDNTYADSLQDVSQQLWDFMQNFLRIHGEFIGRDVYLTGESYAGTYIPHFSKFCFDAENNLKAGEHTIPIKGVAMCSPYTDPYTQLFAADYAFGAGLISEGQMQTLKEQEKACQALMDSNDPHLDTCFPILRKVEAESNVCIYDIRLYKDELSRNYPVGAGTYSKYLNDDAVQQSIHVSKFKRDFQEFQECTDPPFHHLLKPDVQRNSQVGAVIEILEKDIPVLLFSGQFDLIVNHIGVQKWLYRMKWSNLTEFRQAKRGKWKVNGKTAGFVKSYGGLTFVLVRGAGHMVSLDVPEASLDLIKRFIKGSSLTDSSPKKGINPPPKGKWIDDWDSQKKTPVLQSPKIIKPVEVWSNKARISFSVPNGISADAKFRVISSPPGLTADGISSPIEVDGLMLGRPYTFYVETILEPSEGIVIRSAPSNGTEAVIAGCNVGKDGNYSALPCGENDMCVPVWENSAKCMSTLGYTGTGSYVEIQPTLLPVKFEKFEKQKSESEHCLKSSSLCAYTFEFHLLPGTMGGKEIVSQLSSLPSRGINLYPPPHVRAIQGLLLQDMLAAFDLDAQCRNIDIAGFYHSLGQGKILAKVTIRFDHTDPQELITNIWNDNESKLHTGVLTRHIDYSSSPKLEFLHEIKMYEKNIRQTFCISFAIGVLCAAVCFLCAMFRKNTRYGSLCQGGQQWEGVPQEKGPDYDDDSSSCSYSDAP